MTSQFLKEGMLKPNFWKHLGAVNLGERTA